MPRNVLRGRDLPEKSDDERLIAKKAAAFARRRERTRPRPESITRSTRGQRRGFPADSRADAPLTEKGVFQRGATPRLEAMR